ncbi:MAG: response regulator [Lysobacterales bacterium]
MTQTIPLPREIISALAQWQSLRKGAWSTLTAEQAHLALLKAAQLASSSARAPLAVSLNELALYLGFLVDAGIAPNPAQLQRLARLEEAALNLLRAERGGSVADSRRRVLMLAPDTPLWRELARRLDGPEHRVERYGDALALLDKLDPTTLAAVVIDQDCLMDLGSIADRLEGARSAEALGASVIYVNRDRRFDDRILALTSGADVSLEGDDVDHLSARISELLGVLERQDHLRVLVVEDDRSQAMYCESILRKQGVDVQIAGDARGILDEIRSFAPDLVLMDLHMPGISGTQLTSLIREDPAFALVPIVFLTGEQDEASRFNALRAGGDDYLVKPVRPRHLVTAVVSRARRARNLRRQYTQSTPAPVLVHPGEMVMLIRQLGTEHPCTKALLMCSSDSGRLRSLGQHLVQERENQFRVAQSLQSQLLGSERIAPWPGGSFLLLVEREPEDELMARAESLRQYLNQQLEALQAGPCSVAVLPLPDEGLPGPESLIALAERTIEVARYAGGNQVKRALTDAQSDLPPELAMVIQKCLAHAPSAQNTSLVFQPIVPLRGAVRPQFHAHLGLRPDDGGQQTITRRQWLTLARKTGRVLELDHYAVDHVMEQMGHQRSHHGLRMVLAVDPTSVLDPSFRRHVIDGLARRGLPDSSLVLSLEYNEAVLLQARLLPAWSELRAAKVLLCLGRVGAESRGGEVFDTLRPELLAVDAIGLRSLQQTPPVLAYAREHGIEVVAHFIPDAQTLARLFALGVDYGLGSFIGPPGPRLDYDFGEHQLG